MHDAGVAINTLTIAVVVLGLWLILGRPNVMICSGMILALLSEVGPGAMSASGPLLVCLGTLWYFHAPPNVPRWLWRIAIVGEATEDSALATVWCWQVCVIVFAYLILSTLSLLNLHAGS
jgi:hypothetical protein